MKQPHEYKRRILLCVIGKTPQIVTETLYKLTVDSTPAFTPTELHLTTTAEGARSARHALLGVEERHGEFDKFCRDYSMENISFTPQNIHIISGPSGVFIDDALYSEHNQITADFITKTVQHFTQDADCAIHLSLAGGRKTMSYYGGYALSLYGRMQDRLSHVLVARPFQENVNFFYPPPQPKAISVNNTFYSTDEANIILADIPFVRMRYQIPEALLAGKAGFQETVAAIQRFAGPELIEINLNKKELRLNKMKIELDTADLAFYCWICERRKNKQPPLVLDTNAFIEEYIQVYVQIVGQWSGMIDRLEEKAGNWTGDQPKHWFQQRKSKLKKGITQVLGDKQADPFLIQTVEYRDQVGYEITMNKKAIIIN